MPTSLYMPIVIAEVALTSGYTTPAASRVWTDISDWVEAQERISIKRGRQNEQGSAQPSTMSLVLDNRDGRFTPDNVAGAYYPNIKKGRPIRIRALARGNLLSTENASSEAGGTAGYGGGGTTMTYANSTTVAKFGTRSVRGTAAAGTNNGTRFCGSAPAPMIGKTYTWSIYVYVPAATAFDMRIEVSSTTLIARNDTAGLRDQWVRLYFTGTPTANAIPSVQFATGPQAGGELVYFDGAMMQEGALADWTDLQQPGPFIVGVSPVLAQDVFTAADSAVSVWDAPSGPARTVTTGGLTWLGGGQDWGISTNRAYKSTAGFDICTINPGDPNVWVQCVYTTGAGGTDGLAVRYVDFNNHVRVVADAGVWRIQKVIGGVATNLASGGTSAASTSYTLRVECDQRTISLYVNQALACTTTLTDGLLYGLTATRVGMVAGAATDNRWDDFTVYSVYTTFTRFTGYVDDWPTEWPDGTDTMALAPISATSRLARIGLGAEFKNLLSEEIEYDAPAYHLQLGEAAGNTTAGNIAPDHNELANVLSDGAGTLTFGAGIGPPADGLSAIVLNPGTFDAVDAGIDGQWLRTVFASPVTRPGDHAVGIEMWYISTAGATWIYLAHLSAGGAVYPDDKVLTYNLPRFALWGTGGGAAPVRGTYYDSAGGFTAHSPGTGGLAQEANGKINDSVLHHVAVWFEVTDAGQAKARMVCDGVDTGYSGSLTWPYVSGGVAYLPAFDTFDVGGTKLNPSGGLWGGFKGTIAQVAILRSATTIDPNRMVEHYRAGLGALTDTSGQRIARYGRLAGIPVAEHNIDAGASINLAHLDTTGKTPVAAMQEVEATEDGVVFDGTDGRLTFHSRSRRHAATSSFTLDRNLGEVEEGLKPVTDDQGMVNDMSVSRAGGITVRAALQSSIDEYGYYRDSQELLTQSDGEVQDRADWVVNRRGVPRSRLSSVPVDVLNGPTIKLLAADISTRFTLANLPSQSPAADLDLFIEGISEEIGAEEWWMTFNTSAVAYSQVWVLESATASQLDSTTVLGY